MISRRSIAGASLALLSLAALPQASRAAADAVSSEGGVPPDEVWDVLVVGAGAAGLAAAVAAKEAGAKRVLVLEKQALAGGHMIVSSGMLNALDSEGQARAGRRDSAEQFFRDTFEGGGMAADPDLVLRMVNESGAVFGWLKGMGLEFDPKLYEAYTGVYPRAHRTIWARSGMEYGWKLMARARALGAVVRYRTRAERLLFNARGELTGVGVWDAALAPHVVFARSVVLAAGGFGANLAMRARWAPAIPRELDTTYSPGHLKEDPATGDAVRMAEQAGAALAGMEHVLAIPFWGGRVLDYPGAEIFLTNDGLRVTDETAAWDEVFADLAQTGSGEFWVVTDSSSHKGANFAAKVQQGLVSSAATLDELAHRMSVPKSVLEESVRRYNEAWRKKSDPDFGRTRFLQGLSDPPYYFGRERFEIHYTCGGVAITPEAEVKRAAAAGGVIPGLFAAGETTGGVHGKFRLGGNGLLDAFVFGRIAGANAAHFAAGRPAAGD